MINLTFRLNSKGWSSSLIMINPGGTLKYFWWVCAARVSKVGSSERLFLQELWSWKQIFAQIGVFGVEILPKQRENLPRNKKYWIKKKKKKTPENGGYRPKNWQREVQKGGSLERWGSLKKGGCQSSTYMHTSDIYMMYKYPPINKYFNETYR